MVSLLNTLILHLALFIQWRIIFVSVQTSGAGYCDGKAVLAEEFAPLADF